MRGRRLALIMAVGGVLLMLPPARAEMGSAKGWWQFELGGGAGLDAGSDRDRHGDILLTGFAEYELPVQPHATLGFRLMPLFIYTQEKPETETVWGGGVGLAARFYPFSTTYHRWYGEVEGHLLGHRHKLEGNSSNIDFLIGAGIGYRFTNNWHGIVKFEHISNAGLGDQNAGANTMSGGIGYSF